MTLRLLIDYAKKSKSKLHICFIDFEKAHDNVVRAKLITELQNLGCERRMLNVLIGIYKCTCFVFKGISFKTNKGVKQGSSTSSLLFVLYVDKMIKMIKRAFCKGGFLGDIHVLMVMDDAVLLSTSRRNEKVQKMSTILSRIWSVYQRKENQIHSDKPRRGRQRANYL